MTAVAIIQARMGSTRLPGKMLVDLGGRPALAWSVAAAQAIQGVDRVAVATSRADSDDAIAEWCAGAGVSCHRGPEDDVLARYAKAARAEDADIVLRLTGDCPLLDPHVCDEVLALLERNGVSYATNTAPRTWPDGTDCEAMTAAALFAADEEAALPSEREHVTPFLRHNRRRFPMRALICPLAGLADERWTLDTAEDLEFLRAVVARLESGAPPSYLSVLRLLDTAPELREINRRHRAASHYIKAQPAEWMSRERRYEVSQALLRRACSVIPLGSQTFSKSHTGFPAGAAPLFLTHGQGGRVWDVDGNEYVDLICGLLPVVLGYTDPDVDEVIRDQLARGISFSLATELEAELAERLVEIIPCAEMVRYGKNGTDATSAAIRIARAATGRDRVAVCGYHGWQDWYIGATSRNKGVPVAVRELTHVFPYNDLDTLHALLGRHRGEFAAVMLEPGTVVDPAPGFLEGVRDLAHAHGAILIFDEIITGFRFALGGAQALFGVTPDLATFGKALGNGMPISAVVGRADLMQQMEEVFFSGTFGGETLSLAAAIATIDKMRREPVIETLWRTGEILAAGVHARIAANGLVEAVLLRGRPPWMVLGFGERPGASAAAIKTLLLRELLRNGVLIGGGHNVCYAHNVEDMARVLAAYDVALGRVAEELATGRLAERLGSAQLRPVFSVR